MRRFLLALWLCAAAPAVALSEAECAAARLQAAARGERVDPCYPGTPGAAAAAPADPSDGRAERIRHFASHIAVAADGTLTVTETITVAAAGDRIRRGIYRDFPTLYAGGAWGTRSRVPFDVLAVERDGRPEPFHLEALDNGVRVYIGAADVTLPPGQYTYRLTYRTARQLGFFAAHDELYWNVTGNDWMFPIDRAEATVELPATVPAADLTLEGYTGPSGSTARQLTTAVDRTSGALRFATTAPLEPYEGLTIVAAFPKGLVREPTVDERRAAWWAANTDLLAGAAGLVAVLAYYLAVWLAIGRDPARGTIFPRFEPPAALDAPGVRYVRGMGYDPPCFTAGLVALAVKGWLRIEEADGTFTLASANDRHTPLTAAERRLHGALFRTRGQLVLEQTNHAALRAAIDALRQGLAVEYETKLFRTNRRWLVPGLVLSAAALLTMAWLHRAEGAFAMAFVLVWLGVWTFVVLQIATTVAGGWRAALRPGLGVGTRVAAIIAALLATVVGLPFLAGQAAGVFMMSQIASLWTVPLAIALGGINWVFLFLLKQPTRAGRALMDEIDGFRMYLTTAEGDELRQAPPRTPQRFEALLPYAIALGVEHRWSERFADVLQAAGRGEDAAYRPPWYRGRAFHDLGAARFTSMVGSSLSSAVASSATRPGSSSGRSGGGSSGGGGGGGGGGGW